ncbi:YDC1 [Candida oxycetoniae]|uniref:YDC1 n=1 Tax=Candida oxycetoniae TaxID=497107 RepID=A0AAI9WX09_9ASCO|nr:YDC1 [Candida oxycetoniae]KAI3403504.2 YDC1 [Candida oxycetoniae]
MLPFAWPYAEEQEIGYWGKPSSTIDWCELNYAVTPYIAEAVNTVTNAAFIALALLAVYQAQSNHLEKRFIVTAFGFLLVGIGSWCFHMTLRYEYQLLDELPMLYATIVPFWSIYSSFKTKKQSLMIGMGIFLATNLLTIIYLWIKNPTLHQTAYAVLNFCIIYESIILSWKYIRDAKIRKKMDRIAIFGVGIFLFGYLLWNLDIHFCDEVRSIRQGWGIPYGFVLEGHGWWHIFTGTGVYFSLIYEEYLRCFLTGTDQFFTLTYCLGFLPVVTCIDPKGLERYREVKKLREMDDEATKKIKKQ